jgi:tetratricopeptide (TPR) repeat protein
MIRGSGKSWLAGLLAGAALCVLCAPGVRAARVASPAVQPASDPLATAIDHFYNLEYDAAEKDLEARLAGHPNDLRALCYLARVCLQREMFRRELLEARAYGPGGEAFQADPPAVNLALRKKIFGLLDRLENSAQERLKQNSRDTEALYWLGASHVARAVYYLSIEKSNMQALGEAKRAQQYESRLLEVDPNCADAFLVIGTYDYVVGSLPWYMKVLAALVGYHGDRQRGLQELQRAAADGRWARTDAETFLSILYFREKRYAETISILEKLEAAYPRNDLLPQEIARAYRAQKDWRSAARVYDGLLARYESHAPGYSRLPAPKVYFQAGEVAKRLGETDVALRHFQKAAEFQENNIYVYRAELAAARIELREARREEARARLERVARAVPNSQEGRAAAEALRNYPGDPPGGRKGER